MNMRTLAGHRLLRHKFKGRSISVSETEDETIGLLMKMHLKRTLAVERKGEITA
jgi:hypothetical protein